MAELPHARRRTFALTTVPVAVVSLGRAEATGWRRLPTTQVPSHCWLWSLTFDVLGCRATVQRLASTVI